MTAREFTRQCKRRGLRTQAMIAGALGYTQGAVSKWVRGKVPIPPVIEIALRGIPEVQK